MIQQLACPSCGRPLTLNMGSSGNFCLKCRYHWRLPHVAPADETAPPGDSVLTDAELQRLVIYRRAVAAGFFTDWS
jgi:hypothetical protein